MIRKYCHKDTNKIEDLWFQASVQAHNFIPVSYWQQMRSTVGKYFLPNTSTFVFEDKHQIKGFISIIDSRQIGALFVSPSYQGQKIGSKLLNYVKKRYSLLSLNVFAQNNGAIEFYRINDFKIIGEHQEPSTHEKTLQMCWTLGCKTIFFRNRGES